MKKIISLFFIFAVATVANAQLSNTKWKGTIQADEAIDVIFHFSKDTLTVTNTGDASTIEVMTYSAKDTILNFQKVNGQSDCSTEIIGKYKYEMKNGEVTFMLLDDSCEQRSAVLNNSRWTKVE
jgi:hypothetical protein